VAGNGQGQRYAEALEKALRQRGLEVALHITVKAGDGEQMAGVIDSDCVAVVGGDGTVHEVLNGLGERRIRLAILPAGSANVVARELRFPKHPERLAAWIAAGRTRPMDLLRCGGRRVILGGGAGFDAAVAARVKASRGEKFSLWRWVLPTIQTAWSYAYPMIRVVVDGREVCGRSPYVVVGNCPFSAGRFRATPRAKTDDGLLDVVAVKRLNPLRMISLAVGSWLPSFSERKDLVYVQGRHVHLEPVDDVAAPLQLDGDPAGMIPADFEVLPHASDVIVPP
jgi:diacylglycerol kinase (ATP)